MNELNLNDLVIYQELINLQEENEKLKEKVQCLKENYDRIYNENCKLRDSHNITDISLLDKNERLENNWNKLKNWLEENWEHSQDIWFVKIINKMRELEMKSE